MLSALPSEDLPSSSRELGIDDNAALTLVISSRIVQDYFTLDRESLLRRLTMKWTPELALKDCESSLNILNQYTF
jgi:hypothetical protein